MLLFMPNAKVSACHRIWSLNNSLLSFFKTCVFSLSGISSFASSDLPGTQSRLSGQQIFCLLSPVASFPAVSLFAQCPDSAACS